MRLFIAEKPELANAVVRGLGGGKSQQGYIDCGNDKVTWCFGHMLSLFDPEDYDTKYKKWSLSHLPLSHRPWKKKISGDKKQQVAIIKSLLKQATEVVHTGDPDEEGQLLVDELLDFLSCSLPVKRLLINDNTPAVVKKSLQNLRDNADFKGLSNSALARSVADQLYGYNLTRLYTLSAQKQGYEKVLSVGRVQTPILGLVVRRDLEHAAHQKRCYYLLEGTFQFNEWELIAQYQAMNEDDKDDKKRLTNKQQLVEVTQAVIHESATLTFLKNTKKQTPPPLPYNLLKLQADCGRKFNFKPDVVLSVTQSLREKHHLITYNRSDCQYLSDEQHSAAPKILSAIGQTASLLQGVAQQGNPVLKSRAFNSKKVSAHHGIVPTETVGDMNQLTDMEQKIYLLIARAYIAQFFENHQYIETQIMIEVGKHPESAIPCVFKTTHNKSTNLGWLVLYRKDQDNDEVVFFKENKIDLSRLMKGQIGLCSNADIKEKETKPLPLYTISSLLTDLTRAAKYVKDPKIKKLLTTKDKEKAGEHGGIGTPATRSSIIKNLFDRGFIVEKSKKIIATEMGKQFFNILPETATRPDMTALWHEKQQEIIAGSMTVEAFIDEVMNHISNEVQTIKKAGFVLSIPQSQCQPVYLCPQCNEILKKRTGKYGNFWGCSGYPECRSLFKDQDGKPVIEAQVDTVVYPCPDCCNDLRRKKGRKGYFWGCSQYPVCKSTFSDRNQAPLFK